ncbi:MAG: prolyl oligopeptidase family serine peptidase [Atopobiaceae bacterium]|nr:prolyl oligopeptidase family serine peptidase [Atopobiaceae bacterium]
MKVTRRSFVGGGTMAMAAFLAACGNNASTEETTAEEATTEETTEQATTDAAAGDAVLAAFGATVTDAGQYVDRMIIKYDGDVSGVDNDTFKVTMTSTVDYGEAKGEPYAYYDATAPLEVNKVEVEGDTVTVYFRQDQAPTLTWLAEGRNYPAVLGFTVEQTKEITVKTPDGRELGFTGTYDTSATTSWADLLDSEVVLFDDVQDEINYRLYKGTNDKLIVWFHGNGEGDFPTKATNNNIAQVLGNRGTVAWASAEAKEVFGDATVMAFQAPNMWYFAVKDGLLEPCYNEIQKVIEENKINPDEVYLSGCSAGGFMSTRMIIAYPDLFKAAMINCPALDAANARSETEDACPTDEELAQLLDSKTAIWLVQGETDSSVDPELCSKRIWAILTDGVDDITETAVDGTAGIASNFTTYETSDGKYKMSLYETVDLAEVEGISGEKRQGGKIKCAEDYNWSGELQEVKYNDHWTWVFTLRDNPEDASGTHIWEWAAAYAPAE